MADFDSFLSEYDKRQVEALSFFEGYFTRAGLKEYVIDEAADKDSIKAIKTMFTSKKDLRERCDVAFSYDPLCLEAFFVYYVLAEDIYVSYRLDAYYQELVSFADLPAYNQRCYLRILEFYVEFLMDVGNFTKGIKVERQLRKMAPQYCKGKTNRLSFMYSQIEEADDFYRFYLDEEFDTYDYLLLIVTLLKHDDRIRAKEVTQDMFQNIEYASYLDHLWDLDMNDPAQKKFYQTVDDAYDFIKGVPDFFTFINVVREKSEGTI